MKEDLFIDDKSPTKKDTKSKDKEEKEENKWMKDGKLSYFILLVII